LNKNLIGKFQSKLANILIESRSQMYAINCFDSAIIQPNESFASQPKRAGCR